VKEKQRTEFANSKYGNCNVRKSKEIDQKKEQPIENNFRNNTER